jgi:hypothetical protein
VYQKSQKSNHYNYSILAKSKATKKATNRDDGIVALDDNLRGRGIRMNWVDSPDEIMDALCYQLSTYHGTPIFDVDYKDFLLGRNSTPSIYFPSLIDETNYCRQFADPPAIVTNIVYTITDIIVRGEICILMFDNGQLMTLPRRAAFTHIHSEISEDEILTNGLVNEMQPHLVQLDSHVVIEDQPIHESPTNYWIKCQKTNDKWKAVNGKSWDDRNRKTLPWTADMIVELQKTGVKSEFTINCSFHRDEYTPTTDSYSVNINQPFSLSENVRYIYICITQPKKRYLILENRYIPNAPMLGVIGKFDQGKNISIEDGILRINNIVRPCRWSHTPRDISRESGAIISSESNAVNNTTNGIVKIQIGLKTMQISNPTRHFRASSRTLVELYTALIRVTSTK